MVVLNQATALSMLAAALSVWPRAFAVIRLERAVNVVQPKNSTRWAGAGRRFSGWARSRWLRGLLAIGAVGGLTQIWPVPVAAVVIAIAATVGAALVRARRERAVVREDQAAVEGLGILVAELHAGRPPDDALAAAGRHCGHSMVGALLSRLGRSLRLGDRWDGWMDADERAPPAAAERMVLLAARRPAAVVGADHPRWLIRLSAGLRLSQRTGCALADVVAAVESDLARRGQQRADVRATAAGHRATVALLAGLPVLGLAMGSGIGAEPVRILTTTTIGQILLVAGVALELLGLAWSRQLTGRALREG